MALTKVTYSMIDGAPANVLDFGADPTGAADSTAAIQAALAASDSVYLPAGEYKVSSTITLNGGRYLKGESVESVTIKPTSSVTTVFLMEANSYIQLLYIDGTNTTDATGILVGSTNIANLQQITEVTIKNFAGASAKGINIRYAVGITLTSVITRFCTTGLYVLGNSGAFPTHITCYSCTFSQGTKGVHIVRVHVIRFYACLFETNMEEGVYVADGDIAEGLTFDGCWLENNWYGTPSSNYQMYLNGNTGGFTLKDVTVNDCYFYKGPDGGTPFAAKFSRVRNLTFSQNLMPDLVLGDVVFDNNTGGWISNQEFTTADGVLVDTTGFMNDDQSAWRTWTPTYIPQAGTFTSVTTSLSSYTINGNTITLNLTFSGTTSTTPTNITVTYPNIPSTIAPKVGGVLTVPVIISGEPTRAGRCLIHPSGLVFYPDAGWTAGAGRGASVSVTFELEDY